MDIDFLNELRAQELRTILDLLPSPPRRVLEVGAGTGIQAKGLSDAGYSVDAVDIASSSYSSAHIFPVRLYDGKTLPFAEASFDVVFSSHVVEHAKDLEIFHREVRRVLAPEGVVVHAVPTTSWRLWTSATHYPALPSRMVEWLLRSRRSAGRAEGAGSPEREAPAADPDTLGPRSHRPSRSFSRRLAGIVLQARHGERGTLLSEFYHFSRRAWRRSFEVAGWRIVEDHPGGLFYTGNMLLGPRLPLPSRAILAPVLGSAGRIFILEPRRERSACQAMRSATVAEDPEPDPEPPPHSDRCEDAPQDR